jgi:hypothetical protein
MSEEFTEYELQLESAVDMLRERAFSLLGVLQDFDVKSVKDKEAFGKELNEFNEAMAPFRKA